MIFALSLAFGAVIFVRLIGPDAWLIRGLRGDKLGAIIALCSILLCGALIFFLLQFSLSFIGELPIGASAASNGDFVPEYSRRLNMWNVIVGLLSFCVPLATGCLLSLIYRGVYRAVRRLAIR
jgi:hypothetical protein